MEGADLGGESGAGEGNVIVDGEGLGVKQVVARYAVGLDFVQHGFEIGGVVVQASRTLYVPEFLLCVMHQLVNDGAGQGVRRFRPDSAEAAAQVRSDAGTGDERRFVKVQRAAGGGIHGRGIRGVAGVDLGRLAVELAEGDFRIADLFARRGPLQETLAEGQHGAGSGEFAGRLVQKTGDHKAQDFEFHAGAFFIAAEGGIGSPLAGGFGLDEGDELGVVRGHLALDLRVQGGEGAGIGAVGQGLIAGRARAGIGVSHARAGAGIDAGQLFVLGGASLADVEGQAGTAPVPAR